MVDEVKRFLGVRPGGVYVDATVGMGGHAEEILKASAPDGRLIGIDRDTDAVSVSLEKLKPFAPRAVVVQGNFADIASLLNFQNVQNVDGVLGDLGMSSFQVDTAERGFSFAKHGPLDMRMDRSQTTTATSLVNEASEQELAMWFGRYGEERFARRVARAIVQRRAVKPFTETIDFANTVRAAIPAKYRRGKIDAATRVFQALRIVVNGELINLERFITSAARCLGNKGKMVVLSYHSLEDRIVKQRFKDLATGGDFVILTKKPLSPMSSEMKRNPRARSAKLRALERAAI